MSGLLAHHRTVLDARVAGLWEDRHCRAHRAGIEPVVESLLRTGDIRDARESLDMFLEGAVWDNGEYAWVARRHFRDWFHQIHEAWTALNAAELAALGERRPA